MKLKQGTTWLTGNRFVQILFFPLLTAFLFDIPLLNKLLVSLALSLATFIAQDFVEALVKLWQATAITALIFLFVNIGFGVLMNQLCTAVPILFIWFLLLMVSRAQEVVEDSKIFPLWPNLLIFVYLYRLVPRGLYENLAFTYHIDNTKTLGSLRETIQTNQISINLLGSTDTNALAYFIKFVVNMVTIFGKTVRNADALQAINALSNSWMLLTLSYLVIGASFVQWFIKLLNVRSQTIVQAFGLLSMLWGFKISHSAGYFPLMLLNTVVIVFLFSFKDFVPLTMFQKVKYLIVGVSLSCAMFGSWQPWLPVACLSILVILYKILGRALLIRTFRRSIILYPMVVATAFIGWIYLFPKLTQIDLESSGRDHFPTESLFFIAVISLVLISSLFGKSSTGSLSDSVSSIRFEQRGFLLWPFVALFFGLVFNLPQNQSETVWFVLAIGLVFNRYSVRCIKTSIKPLLNKEAYDAPILFCLLSFGFVLLIFTLSRFIGPVYEPMYAADKSAVAFYSQFFWLPLVVIGSLEVFDRRANSRSRMAISLTVICLGLQIPFAVLYSPVQSKWWHRPIVDSLTQNPNRPIVCSNSSEFLPENEVWVCTRFMDVLTDDEFTEMFSHQQIQLVGPRPVDLSRSREILIERPNSQGLVVFSCAPLDIGMTDFFGVVAKDKIEFFVEPSCDV